MGKDVIMLLIEQIAMVLAYAFNLGKAGMNEEALQTIDECLDPLFDGSPDEVEADRMIATLRDIHADGPTVLGVVRLIHERGEVLARLGDDRCFAQYPKGLRIALALLPDDQWREGADLLYSLYRQSDVTEEERIRVLEGMEAAGRYAYAEDILFECMESWPTPENRDRGMAFYERLLKLDDETLEQGGLPREEALEGKAAFEKLMEGS